MPTGIYIRKIKPIESRFWPKVTKTATCWLWTGGKSGFGHGTILNSGYLKESPYRSNVFAHRVSYQMAYGPIPSGLCVLHSCDVPSCVNPSHLFLGTKLDNMQDMRAKGRDKLGLELPQTKLTNIEVAEIRESSETQRALAKKYGVSQPLICAIKKGNRRMRLRL